MTLFGEILSIVIAILLVLVAYFKWRYQYWKKRNVPFLEPKIPWGNLENPARRKETIGLFMKHMYDEIKAKGNKYCGIYIFSSPAFFVVDPDLLKQILTKDFNHFVDRGFYYNEKYEPIGAHLFAIGGEKWRHLRTKLSPTFTSGKLKHMFQTLVECGTVMEDFMKERIHKNEPLDIREVLACFTVDVIGSCAFGVDSNSFKKPDSQFRKYSRKIFFFDRWRSLKTAFSFTFPKIARVLGVKLIQEDVTEFFTKMVKDNVTFREKNNYIRKDFMQLLIEIKNNTNQQESLTMDEVVAQCFIFWVAGFETSSTTMSFAFYELATHPEIQEKVREEIVTVLEKHDNKITYDSLNDMKYMSQVIDETLRKYPPLPLITRVCTNNYKVPGEDVVIEKGTKVFIPIMGFHHDEDVYKNPSEFNPDRFSEENKKHRHQYSFIPFGEGQRICIGMRFGIMQTKLGLTCLLRNYRFVLNKKTKLPLKLSPLAFILSAEGDIWLDFEKI